MVKIKVINQSKIVSHEYCEMCDEYCEKLYGLFTIEETYDVCKNCKKKNFVYMEEHDQYYNLTTYINSAMDDWFGNVSYKKVNYKYNNYKKFINNSMTKKEIKQTLSHFGVRFTNFDKIKKDKIIEFIKNN